MSTITREQAQKIIEAADEVITALAGTNEDVHPESDNMLRLWDDLNDRYAPPEVVRELARIALASLEAKPRAFIFWPENDPSQGFIVDSIEDPAHKPGEFDAQGLHWVSSPLYTAPTAPVSVPDEVTAEDCPAFVKYDITEVDEAWARGWNACRAAMLKGATGNSPVIKDGLSTVCAEAYQVVGVMADALGIVDDAAVQKVMDNLSQQKLVHGDVLPFSLPAAPQLEASREVSEETLQALQGLISDPPAPTYALRNLMRKEVK